MLKAKRMRVLILYFQKQRRVLHNGNYTIKLPPKEASRIEYMTTSVNDEIYLFGGKNPTSNEPCQTAAKYSFATQSWTELASLPNAMIASGVARGRLSLENLRCHLDCPHCSFYPLKDRTTYNVPAVLRDRDYGPSGGMFDLDNDNSDESDDDDYYDYEDPFDHSDDGWGHGYIDPDEWDVYDIF